MMKKTFQYMAMLALVAAVAVSCEKDDTDFSAYTNAATTGGDNDGSTGGDNQGSTATSDSIFIVYNGTTASVTNDPQGYVSVSEADVTVTDVASTGEMVLVLSGSTTDGSLLVNRQRKFTIVLNGVTMTNADGPAINNQCGKALYVYCPEGTVNTLADGTAYATRSYDQKGAFFSEGQIYFSGTGTLTVTGNCKNAIASDDYITIENGAVISATASATATNGVKANDGVFINGGLLTVNVASAGGRGIRCEARTVIAGGTVDITTTGSCKIETVDGVRDTTSAACIKSDSLFTMTGGTVTLTSTGDGGKGINCNENVEFSGGTLVVKTTGGNSVGKPKAVKSLTGIKVSGGSFTATVSKSWACDNGTDSENPADRLTILGTPTTKTVEKRSVVVKYM